MIWRCLIALLALTGAAQAQTADTVLDAARAECQSFDGGTLFVPDTPLTDIDLNGDGVAEQILDFSTLQCSTLAAFASGTGGSILHVFAGDRHLERMALGWQMTDVQGGQVLLFSLHGSECGTFGVEPCVEAVTLGSEGFLTLRGATQQGADQ